MKVISLCESCVWADSYAEILPDSDGTPLSNIGEGYVIGSLPCGDHGNYCDSCDSPSSQQYFGRVCHGCDTRYAGARYDYNLVWLG